MKSVKMATERNKNPVARGGMWNTAQASYSKETQNLLKEMMRESKLTNFQQRQLNQAVQDGRTLPKKVHPTTSAKPKPPPQPVQRGPRVDPRAYAPVTRTKEDIESSGAYERDMFAPKPLNKYRGSYSQDKERLSNILAYGEDLPPPNFKEILKKAREEAETPPPRDRFDELQAEVDDRQNFLSQMESLGQGDKYRGIIATEVSQLVREMEVIDKKRTAELNRRIAKQEQSNKSKQDQA